MKRRTCHLGNGEHYVVEIHASGLKRAVVERQNNIISIDEVRQHQAEVNKAMLDELQRWSNRKAFERMPKALAHNVVDSCWVLKWKEVNGKMIIHARLVVRGFKDHQATQLNTFAGTTSRWGQRIVNSVAAQNRWEIFTADVSQAFLRGLTFEQTSEMKDEVRREVQFTVPPGSVDKLKKLPGFENFNAMLEVLRLLRCGFGLKDAPRLWNKLLTEELKKIGLKPLQSDPQLYVWHVNESASAPTSGGSPPAGVGRLVLIISIHVDDFKGAGEEKYRQIFLKALEARFGQLKINHRSRRSPVT